MRNLYVKLEFPMFWTVHNCTDRWIDRQKDIKNSGKTSIRISIVQKLKIKKKNKKDLFFDFFGDINTSSFGLDQI